MFTRSILRFQYRDLVREFKVAGYEINMENISFSVYNINKVEKKTEKKIFPHNGNQNFRIEDKRRHRKKEVFPEVKKILSF